MKAAGRALAPMMRDVYREIEEQYPVDRPTRGIQYVPPHRRNQVTMEEIETKNAMLQQSRNQALMQNAVSELNYNIKINDQIGPATQLLAEVDPASPDAFNQIRQIQKQYPLAFQDSEFNNSAVDPLLRLHGQYMQDIPKPKTEDEVMEDIIKIRGQQKAILDSVGAKSLDDLRRKGDPVDAMLYERLNRQIDSMMGVGRGGGGGGGGALDMLNQLTGGTGAASPSATPAAKQFPLPPDFWESTPQQTMPPSSAATPAAKQVPLPPDFWESTKGP
jgi:hypothetical protein